LILSNGKRSAHGQSLSEEAERNFQVQSISTLNLSLNFNRCY